MSKENYSRRVLKPLGESANIPNLNFQSLRRTLGTQMQGLGSQRDIATMLRHKNPQTAAEHYTMAMAESVRAAQNRLADALLKPKEA